MGVDFYCGDITFRNLPTFFLDHSKEVLVIF